MQLTESVHTLKKATIEALRNDRLPHWNLWRELANFYISRRYIALQSGNEMTRVKNAKNPYILDGTGTIAARVLASGMMNGVTSPGRPWFKLRIAGQPDEVGSPQRIWLDEVARRMMMIMSESNFYNALAVLYLDLVVFGSAAMIIYEDYDNVIHCYNPALGEFYFAQSDKLQVNTFARDLTLKVHQIVQWFGIENVSITTKEKYQRGGAQAQADTAPAHDEAQGAGAGQAHLSPGDRGCTASASSDRSFAKRHHLRQWYQQRRSEARLPNPGPNRRDVPGHTTDPASYQRGLPQRSL
jgi:hypothetical protein